ncbi:MAG: RcpC/CpaB family pilus assembly protein [Actinomycetota bacterium]|nr:RcpC/CpaB family pilus assembly protein [Actinomycetota bacterium]
MNRRRKLMGIIASVVLAALGTGLLVAYVRSAEDRALDGEEAVGVLVVTETIPKGTRAEDVTAKVKTEQVPSKVVAQGSVADLRVLNGLVAGGDLLPGEQLVQSRFAAAAATGVAIPPPGALRVTVAMDALRAVGGQVRTGDSVGLVASFAEPETSRLVLQKVPVTDVRTEAGVAITGKPDGTAVTGRLWVTLAVDAPSVERVVFAAEHGTLWLAWEPKEANEAGTKVQTRAGVNL